MDLQNRHTPKLLSVIARKQNMEQIFPPLHQPFLTVCISYRRLNGPFFRGATKGGAHRCSAHVHTQQGKAFRCTDLHSSVVLTRVKNCQCRQPLRDGNKCVFHSGIMIL